MVRTLPSAARTVFGVGPGVKVWPVIFRLPCEVVRSSPRLPPLAAEQRLLRVLPGEGSQRVGPTACLRFCPAPGDHAFNQPCPLPGKFGVRFLKSNSGGG